MVVASPRSAFRGMDPIPSDWPDEADHRRKLADGIRKQQERALKHPVNVVAVTAAYTMVDIDLEILANATGGAFSVTLLTAAGREGRRVIVKKTDSSANAVTVDAAGTETIDGATTFVLPVQYAGVELVSDGTNWHIVAHGGALGTGLVPLVQIGSFTPGLSFGGGTTGLTYTTQVGRYTKIGNRCFFNAYIDVNSNGSSSGTALLTGLPFTSANVSNGFSAISFGVDNVDATVITSTFAIVQVNATTAELRRMEAGNSVALTEVEIIDGSDLFFGGQYQTA